MPLHLARVTAGSVVTSIDDASNEFTVIVKRVKIPGRSHKLLKIRGFMPDERTSQRSRLP